MSAVTTSPSGQSFAPASESAEIASPAPHVAGRNKKAAGQAQAATTASATAASQSSLFNCALLLSGVACTATLGLGLGVAHLLRGGRREKGQRGSTEASSAGPCAKLKPTSRCVALADGSACVIRREIAADNSCLFNSVGYVMHKSRARAPHLRTVVAQQVSSDRTTYSDAFLGMTNESYCNWIRQSHTWGGGIELSILAQAYGMEIAAWNIESRKEHIFGEESGYKRQVMVIYNGVHYDALAVCLGPRANPEDDETSYNPRTKRGKMIIAAARKLVELAHKESLFHGATKKQPAATATAVLTAAKAPTANGTSAAATGGTSGSGTAVAGTTSRKTASGVSATRRVARGTTAAAAAAASGGGGSGGSKSGVGDGGETAAGAWG
ncbi:hypothetical protein Vretimale_6355 [Volvox reticuliferus]|uniref:Ubiquitin thioesterase OTU n=1 Tax=Volvox reticuliferus TaxID=1737510 RepID=A0A8J4G7F2_9CHLO|nr:hypothetical protein Vretimale_6355 [Volvox reticuliferus]